MLLTSNQSELKERYTNDKSGNQKVINKTIEKTDKAKHWFLAMAIKICKQLAGMIKKINEIKCKLAILEMKEESSFQILETLKNNDRVL